jgi:hypothetical protein
MKRRNYLNNRDMLAEIHKSKSRFSSFTKPEYHQYDIIVGNVDSTASQSLAQVTPSTIAEAKHNRAKRLSLEAYETAYDTNKKIKPADCTVDSATIADTDLVFRVMTFDHIPDEEGRKKTVKSVADSKTKLNFPPFQHWMLTETGEWMLVGKSHWVGDMDTGYFSKTHARATDNLGRMWMKLCERYGTRGNVRNYTYNDEMRGQAILQLAQIGLQFDESQSDNPFAYYTQTVTNSFVRVINIEKRNQNIRDDILQQNGLDPSLTRLHNSEWEASMRREADNADADA